SGFIQQQSAVGKTGVGHAFERIQCRQLPGPAAAGRDVKDNSTAVRSARCARSVEAPSTVGKQTSSRPPQAIIAAGEGVNDLLFPGAACVDELVDHTCVAGAAQRSGTVNRAVRVDRDPGTRSPSIFAANKAVNDAVRPGSTIIGELEHGTAACIGAGSHILPAHARRTVKISLCIEGDTLVGFATVGAASETVKDGVNSCR